MTKRKIVILKILIISIFVAIALFIIICLRYVLENTFLCEAKYTVTITNDDELEGKLYSIKSNIFLLVLTQKTTQKSDGYYIDMNRKTIGIPDFAFYKPLAHLKAALVGNSTKEGYPIIGEIDPSSITVQGNEIHVFVEEFSKEARKTEPSSADFIKTSIIYQKNIILKPKR
jgi:hypothetical protein